MKVEIVDKSKPDLRAGQLWKKGPDIYLAISDATEKTGVSLMLANGFGAFEASWAHNRGFGGAGSASFEYIGDLKITP